MKSVSNTTKLVGLALGMLIIGWALGSFFSDGKGDAGSSGAVAAAEPTTWTCSMHPAIQQPKFGLCPICAMDLIPLKKSGSALRPSELVMSVAAKELARINTVPVERRLVDAEVSMVGKIDYDETRMKTIAAWFPARIDRLYVDYTGIEVVQGDHLASVYSPELLTAQRELLSSIKFGNADVGTVKDKLRLWGLSEEKIRTIAERGETDEHMDVNAPFGGIVVHKAVKEGDYVKTGGPLFTIADLSRVWVQLDAYESDLPWLRFGQKVEFEAEAVPGKIFEGVITFISPSLDPATRTVKVRVNADNADFALKPGMFVRATAFASIAGGGKVISEDLAGKWISRMHPEIIRDEPGDCPICGMALTRAENLGYTVIDGEAELPLVVPTSAVLRTGKRSVVYVELPDTEEPTYEGRSILLGARAGGVYIVEEGLMEGERVVIEGAFKIDSALQIMAKPSMMSSGGGGHQHGGAKKSGAGEGMKTIVYRAPDAFKGQLAAMLDEFFKVQAALAGDDLKGAAAAATAMGAALGEVDMALVEDDAHMAWMTDIAPLKDGADLIAAGKDIAAVRKSFEDLSETATKVAMSFAIEFEGPPALLMYCPMALDGKGANWLQRGEDVRNPYFGASMLGCGDLMKDLSKAAQ